jgi:hypothetical protein
MVSRTETDVSVQVDELLTEPIFVTYYDEILTRHASSGTTGPKAADTKAHQPRIPRNADSDGPPNS